MKNVNNKTNREQWNSSRREFLKVLGFGAGVTALLPACEQPVRKMIPYLIQPEEIIPGKALHYASTFRQGNLACPVVVKSRDGRPIKVEGNDLCSITKGGTNARIQASILDLYNPNRLKDPAAGGKKLSWNEANNEIIAKLGAAGDKKIAFITTSIYSPTEKKALNLLIEKFPNLKILEIDHFSNEATRTANKKSFGLDVLPQYDFTKADLVVAFNADFLGTLISPIQFAKQYSARKNPGKNQIRHIHFETTPTITGAAADERYPINPSEELTILKEILAQLKFKTPATGQYNLEKLVSELLSKKEKSMVLSGTNSIDVQLIVNAINFELGNLGKSINFKNEYLNSKGKDENNIRFEKMLIQDELAGAIFYHFDPATISGKNDELKHNISKLNLSVYIGVAPPENQEIVQYILPANHYLESWADYQITPNYYSLSQPLIKSLFNTLQGEELLLRWAGIESTFHDFLNTRWEEEIFPLAKTDNDFNDFWNETLQKGVLKTEAKFENTETKILWDKNSILDLEQKKPVKKSTEVEIHLFESSVLGDGSQATNPWLLELPDPVTKQCWGNAALISPEFAKNNQLKNGQHIEIDANRKKIEIPVLTVPGQANNSISIALNFGKNNAFLGQIGVNANPFVKIKNGLKQYHLKGKINVTQNHSELAIAQTQHSQENRQLSRQVSVEDYHAKDELFEKHHRFPEMPEFYNKTEFPGYHWGLAIDLNKCTGCGACVIACQAENNIPVVGKEEVIRKHEMHWLRIDRYFEGEEANPAMLVQPVMCQQCDNAPCENVCPVSATNHSIEGINQMAYNRCIGTRYCANNCPYKVRRFNWFDYTRADAFSGNERIVKGTANNLARMALNPDVTVRSRGVIEKCSFCIQRIIEAKNKAKLENRPIRDGEIKMACEQSCPSDAMVFGNMNDPESRISKLIKSKRSYQILEELNTLPSVTYQAKLINKKV